MRASSACALAALSLMLAIACMAPASVQAHQEREILMNTGGAPPKPLADAGVAIIHGLPRANGAKDHLERVDYDNPDDVEAAKKYAYGVILPIAICFALGLLTWAVCAGFCFARSCCNGCGGRMATRTYSTKDQLWLKLGTLLLAACGIILFGIGLVSNAAISSSLDDAYVKCDHLVEHLYLMHAPLKSMQQSTTDALKQITGLNTTVLAQLPANVDSYRGCMELMYTTVMLEQQLLAQIAPLTGTSAGSSSSETMNLTDLASSMRSLQSTIATMPNLRTDAAYLVAYNQSLNGNLPFPIYTAAYIPSRDVANAQRVGIAGNVLSSDISSGLNVALPQLNSSITPFRSYLGSFDASLAKSSPANLDTIISRLSNANDHDASLQTLINNFDASVALLPAASPFQSSVTSFTTQLASMQSASTKVLDQISVLDSALQGIGDGTAFTSMLSSLIANVANINHASSLIPNLQTSGSRVSTLSTRVAKLQQSIENSVEGIAALTNSNGTASNHSVAANILAVNSSLPRLSCIRPVFSQLTKLNTSVLVLPPALSGVLDRRAQILVQLSRLLRVQHDLNASYVALGALASSLSAFPNLQNISKGLAAVKVALDAFPDNTAAALVVQNLDAGFAAIKVSNHMQSIQTAFPAFLSAVAEARSNVTNMYSLVSNLDAAIRDVPALPANNVYSAYASSINTLATDMRSSLTALVNEANSGTFLASGISAATRNNFIAKATPFRSGMNSAPSNTNLEAKLDTLRTRVMDATEKQSGILSTLGSFRTAAQTFPNSTALATAMARAWEGTSMPPLAPLLTGIPHVALNVSLAAMPSMTSAAVAIDVTAANTKAQSGSFSLLAEDLSTTNGFINPGDMTSVESGLDAMESLLESFPDLAGPIDNLAVASGGLIRAETKVADYRHRYYVARQKTVTFKNHIDWLRLLGFMLVLFVPSCVALCGGIAWAKRKHVLSLYMGMCSFSIAAIFFIMTAVQLAPAMLFADQCVDVDGFMRAQFEPYGLSANAAQPWVNLTAPVETRDLFTWFSACEGTKPELIDVFRDPRKVLANNNINFTDYRVRVTDSLQSSNNTIDLRPRVWAYFDHLDSDVSRVILASLQAYSIFTDCEGSAEKWEPFRDSVCSSQGVSGAIALSTCICFLFAICTLPGVCVGVVGYKRFDPQNFGVTHLMEQTKGFDSIVADPYAAGLAERPSPLQAPISPTNAGRGAGGGRGSIASPSAVASPLSYDNVLASPSLAVAPQTHSPNASVDTHGIELQVMQPQASRASVASSRGSVSAAGTHLVIASPSAGDMVRQPSPSPEGHLVIQRSSVAMQANPAAQAAQNTTAVVYEYE